MVGLNKEQGIICYRYLASVSLFGLVKDYIYAKYLLHKGSIEKLQKPG